MMKPLFKPGAFARRLQDERGTAMLEMAICLPLILFLVFGLIDFSQIISSNQIMSGISRQGSNLASRTYRGDNTSLQTVVSALVTQGASLKMSTRGRIIVTVVEEVNGRDQIIGQAESPTGISVTSRIGTGVGNRATMPADASTVLDAGQAVYVTEVFYSYSPMTPVGNFLKKSLASILYEVAYF